MTAQGGPLAGLKVIELSIAGPAGAGTHLADLGADVIKVEPPSGDYIRAMTWPIIEGNSLMHLHLNRGKKSITLDLRVEEARQAFLALAKDADIVFEAMRPGALARRGLGPDVLQEANPALVFCTVSGYGATGPYTNMPSHGIAYDTWAGVVDPAVDDEGFTYIPEHVSIGIYATPMLAAMTMLAGVVQARATGKGSVIDIGQSDVAAFFDWYRSETWMAYDRPEDEVTGNKADDFARRAPGTAGMREGVRYQIYASSDGHVLFMASEQSFWKNFCEGVDRMDLFQRWPGSTIADHAKGNRELQAELRTIFATKTSAEWIAFSNDVNTPIAPVNSPKTLPGDPQFQARFDVLGHEAHGADMLAFPAHFTGASLPTPSLAPTVGEHTDDVLRNLGWSEERIEAARAAGALG